MVKELVLHHFKIQYELQYKNVKNINLRIKPDGKVHVSANRHVPQTVIDAFVRSKADLIQKAVERYQNLANVAQKRYFTDDELCEVVLAICERVYPYFAKKGIAYPKIKFRKMVSRWGSCQVLKGILTFSTNLVYVPQQCIEYVVLHEFTHFLQANHSDKFYAELEKICPGWKMRRKELKACRIR